MQPSHSRFTDDLVFIPLTCSTAFFVPLRDPVVDASGLNLDNIPRLAFGYAFAKYDMGRAKKDGTRYLGNPRTKRLEAKVEEERERRENMTAMKTAGN